VQKNIFCYSRDLLKTGTQIVPSRFGIIFYDTATSLSTP